MRLLMALGAEASKILIPFVFKGDENKIRLKVRAAICICRPDSVSKVRVFPTRKKLASCCASP